MAVSLALLALVSCTQKTSISSAGRLTLTPTTNRGVVGVAGDQAVARALLIEASDFPPEWVAVPHHDSPFQKAYDSEFAACLDRPSADTHTTAYIYSFDFYLANAHAVSNARVVRTVGDFKADVAADSGPKYASCLKRGLVKFFPRELPPGASVQSVALEHLVVDPLEVASRVEFSRAFRATIELKFQGESELVYEDGVLLGGGRIELSAAFSNTGQPFDPSLKQTLLAKLAAGLEATSSPRFSVSPSPPSASHLLFDWLKSHLPHAAYNHIALALIEERRTSNVSSYPTARIETDLLSLSSADASPLSSRAKLALEICQAGRSFVRKYYGGTYGDGSTDVPPVTVHAKNRRDQIAIQRDYGSSCDIVISA